MTQRPLNFKEFINWEREKPVFSDWDVYKLYMSEGGVGVREIAERTGRSIGEVYRTIRRMGVEPNRAMTNHENVRMFAASGMKVERIADLTGYTPRNVRYILRKQ